MEAVELAASAAAQAAAASTTEEAIRQSRDSIRAYKGHITSKRKAVEEGRKVLSSSLQAGTPNPGIVNWQCTNLQKGLNDLMGVWDRYQSKVSEYMSLSEGTDEVNQDRYKNLIDSDKTLTDEIYKIQAETVQVLCTNPTSPAQAAAGGSAPAQAPAPKPKPEKELKPDTKLQEDDSLDTYMYWVTQFRTYFSHSHFEQASPEEQRMFMSKCMDSGLWRRIAGGETSNERKLPLDPKDTSTGLFATLQNVFGLKDPLLLKRLELFTTQKFSGQQYESFSAYLSRRMTLKKEANFYDMSLEDVDLCWAFQGIQDPKLRKKILALEDPSYNAFVQEGKKYELLQRKLGIDEERKGGTTAPGGCNAVQASRNTRFCRLCGLKCDKKYNICSTCYDKKVKRDKEAKAQEGNQSAPTGRRGRGGGRGRAPGRGGSGRGARGGRGRGRGRGYSRFSKQSENPLNRGRIGAIDTPAAFEDGYDDEEDFEGDEYFGDDDAYDGEYEETGYEEGVNAVTVTVTQGPQPKQPAVFKVDETAFIHGKAEFAWRLKAIARSKHHRIRSDKNLKPNSLKITLTNIMVMTFAVMKDLVVMPILLPILEMWGFLSNMVWEAKCLTKTLLPFFRDHSQFMGVGSISCSRVGTSEEIDTHSQQISNAEQRKALKAIHSSMEKGSTITLDNMKVVLGNSKAEAQCRSRIRAHVLACPDTGASRSLIGPEFAKKFGCRVHREKIRITNASGASMTYEGTVYFKVIFNDREADVPVLLSTDVEGRVILGRFDLIALHAIPPNFPSVLPQELFSKQQQ